jgi:hypothetical protein
MLVRFQSVSYHFARLSKHRLVRVRPCAGVFGGFFPEIRETPFFVRKTPPSIVGESDNFAVCNSAANKDFYRNNIIN